MPNISYSKKIVTFGLILEESKPDMTYIDVYVWLKRSSLWLVAYQSIWTTVHLHI